MKTRKAFTLIELVITITIVAVLSAVSIPIYKGYTRQAQLTEGYALINAIRSAEHRYYSEYKSFYFGRPNQTRTCNDPVLCIDARGNRYFTSFEINNNWNGGYVLYLIRQYTDPYRVVLVLTCRQNSITERPVISGTDGYGRTL